jgi:predicted Zn-dependent protease
MTFTYVRIGRSILSPALLLLAAGAHAQLPPGTSDASSSSRPQLQYRQEDPARTEAASAMAQGDFRTALKLLTTLDTKYPNDARVLFDLASAQDALDETTPAEATYRRSIAADPRYLEPHLALGLLLARSNRASDARTELLSATNLNSPDPAIKARAYRALAHLDATSNPAEARDALLSAIKLSPETTDDALLSAQLAEQAHSPEGTADAERAYRRLLARSPNDPAATSALAHLLVTENKSAEAEPLLTDALATHPGDPALSAYLATLYLHENKPEEATALLEKLHTQNPSDPAVTRLYAHLLSQTGKYAEAEPLFAALSSQSPSDPTLLDARADALIHLKRYPEAQQILERAIAQISAFPSHDDAASAASHLAFAATQNNDPNTVLHALDLRATFLPQSPSSLFLAAAAHDKLHHRKQAIDLYQQFLSVANGKFPDEEWEARHRLIALEHMK